MADAQIRFYDWPHSPFCMKVRAILDYKRLRYERVNPLGANLLTIRRKGGVGKVPALELDGAFIADSTDIAHALEARFPHPTILPAGARDRGLCHALEDWADEALYFTGLYYRWYEREGRKPIPAAFGKSPAGRLTYRFFLRRILGQLKGQGTLRKSPEHVRRDLERQLDAVEAQVGHGPFLLGEAPYLCDFALWGQIKYLERTPVGAGALSGREPIARYQERMQALLAPPA